MGYLHRFRHAARMSAFSLSVLLGACGGGGGGTPDPAPVASPGPTAPADTGFTVSIDRTELKFSAEEGQALYAQAVLGTGTGTLPAAIYTGSVDQGTGLDHVTMEIVGSQVKFTVFPKSHLAPGDYHGTLMLLACVDALCAKQFSGSPASVPYTITITKAFKVNPAKVSLTALSGATAGADVAVQLPTGQSSYTLNSSATWLAMSKITPTGFSMTTQPMPPGDYAATVSVMTPVSIKEVQVRYLVTGDSTTITRITPDPSSVSFTAIATDSTASRTVNVALPSWTSVLDAQVLYTGDATGWLSLVRSGERSYSLSASAAALAPGTYQANLLLTSGPLTTAVFVPVTFTVGAASWSVGGVTSFPVGIDTAAASLNTDIAIDLPGLPAQAWTASTGAAWLKLGNTGGTTGSTGLHVSVDRAEMLKLDNFKSHTAEVAIAAANSRIAPTKVVFTLVKSLPEVYFVSPHTRLPGEAGSYIVRGRGFDGAPDLQQALQVNGATPVSVTRVNDTQLAVQLPGAADGTVSFAMNNAMGVATGAPVLQVVPQGAFAYRAVVTEGHKGGIVFDPERQSIYTVNKTLHAVMRFAYNGSAWDVTSAPVPAADEVALAPDGKSLVVTATSGNVLLLDPSSLATQGTYSTGAIAGYEFNSLPLLAVTNNGKAFFQGSTWSAGMPYFDLVTRQFGAVTSDRNYSFYDGPWYSVSGDGSRLLVVQSAAMTPSPGMLYMNSSDEVTKLNPAGLTFWYDAAQSLHGERFVEGTYKVWDRDFNLIGNLVLPDTTYYGRTPVVSPDGTRVYVLAHSSGSGTGSGTSRVYVFDSSTRMVTTTNLPVLGYFDVDNYSTCNPNDYGCNPSALGTISPDGKTLFFLGSAALVVAPIPALTPTAQPVSIQHVPPGAMGVSPATVRVAVPRH